MFVRKKGFMMIEAVFSIFITGIALVAFLNVLGIMYKAEFNKRDYVIATNLAQEEIELVRNIRDNNWKTSGKAFDCPGDPLGCHVFPSNGNLCIDYSMTNSISCDTKDKRQLYINNDEFYQYDSSNAHATKFYRYFILSGSGDSRIITVSVTWDNNEIKVQDTLYAWADAS